MKNNKYHTVWTVPKSNRKIVAKFDQTIFHLKCLYEQILLYFILKSQGIFLKKLSYTEEGGKNNFNIFCFVSLIRIVDGSYQGDSNFKSSTYTSSQDCNQAC
jgi:hypothetical protein